jgi:hypothetical protein
MIRNGELFVIHELHQEGLSISAIARRTGLSRKTVRKYLQQGLKVPRYGPRAPRPQLLDPYRGYLRERVEAQSTVIGSERSKPALVGGFLYPINWPMDGAFGSSTWLTTILVNACCRWSTSQSAASAQHTNWIGSLNAVNYRENW